MRNLVYYVGTTLDGYIAGPDGEFDFLPLADDVLAWIAADYPETIPTHARAQFGLDVPNRAFDTVVMGRGTYQPGLDLGVTSPYAHLRQYVVSTTTGEIKDPAVELVASDPVGLVRRLKEEDGLDIWLAGGGVLAGAVLPEIDRLIVKTYPLLAGGGTPMVNGPFDPTAFTVTDRRTFDSGASVTWLTRNS